MRILKYVLAAALLSSTAIVPIRAADHREAPIVNGLPQADINDIYAFRDPANAGRLILVMTVNPFSIPDVAGSYNFSSDVVYRFAFDRTGDARFESAIDVTFSPLVAGAQTFKARFPGGQVVTGAATRPTVAATGANPPVIATSPSGIKVFAGPRDDPFFFDAAGFNRVVAGGAFTNRNAFAGVNVSAIVIDVPIALVAGNSNTLQIEGFTYLAQGRPFSVPNTGPAALNTRRINLDRRPYGQLDRMGNPAVATALIPGPLKDAFNRGLPQNDAASFGPAIVASLTAFDPDLTNAALLASVALPDTLKYDFTQPDGYPNGRPLQDDVIDILLKLILNNPAVTDGANANDQPFLSDFPFLGPPQQVP
jgi:hypothetical protein